MNLDCIDLFSAAAGGWSLGMERAGFRTRAACEKDEWRRILYAENNPGVILYDDVCTLTADRVRADLGAFPAFLFGSPPCQDISSANTKGKGVEGARSGLFFEAVRLIGEGRPRWFALENSANLRTRGADRVLGELEALGYTCWTFVVGGDTIGANHERKRSWIIGVDLAQLADACNAIEYRRDALGGWSGRAEGSEGERAVGCDLRPPADVDPSRLGHEGGRARRHGAHGHGSPSATGGDGNASDTDSHALRLAELPRRPQQEAPIAGDAHQGRNPPDPDEAGQQDGSLEPRLRQAEVSDYGCGAGRSDDGQGSRQMGLCPTDRRAALQHRADWSLDDLAGHIRLDDGLPAWVAEQRIAVGGPRGTTAASLIVEAFGDAVLPQIPEAIGRAILRVERAYAAVHGAGQ